MTAASPLVGRTFDAFEFEVDRSQLRLFAKAIGEQRSEYQDAAAARALGYADIAAPPTFLFSVGMSPADPFDFLSTIGADLARVLHGAQAFRYGEPLVAGRTVRVSRRVAEEYVKKGGTLRFVVVELSFEDAQSGVSYGETRQTVVVREGTSA